VADDLALEDVGTMSLPCVWIGTARDVIVPPWLCFVAGVTLPWNLIPKTSWWREYRSYWFGDLSHEAWLRWHWTP